MNKQELYDKVVKLVKKDPFPRGETTLWEWIMEGDTDGATPAEIAQEWDELPEMETDENTPH